MAFQKGQPRPANSGRKPGATNVKKLKKVTEVLAEGDISPIKEIIALIPELRPREQLEAWSIILSYCEAKPRAPDTDPNLDQDGDPDLENMPTAELRLLVKPPHGNV